VRSDALAQQREVWLCDIRAAPTTDANLDQAGRLQRPEGVPDRHSADAELRRHLPLGGQPVARLVAAGKDGLPNLCDHVGRRAGRLDGRELGLGAAQLLGLQASNRRSFRCNSAVGTTPLPATLQMPTMLLIAMEKKAPRKMTAILE